MSKEARAERDYLWKEAMGDVYRAIEEAETKAVCVERLRDVLRRLYKDLLTVEKMGAEPVELVDGLEAIA